MKFPQRSEYQDSNFILQFLCDCDNFVYYRVSGNGRATPQNPTDRPLTDSHPDNCRHRKKLKKAHRTEKILAYAIGTFGAVPPANPTRNSPKRANPYALTDDNKIKGNNFTLSPPTTFHKPYG